MIDSQTKSESPLVFLDIDGTLLDSDYSSNDPTLPEYIQRLQTDKGFVFGLNSNRSLEDMVPIAKQFAITGPLIGENGIFAYFLNSDKLEYFLDDKSLWDLQIYKKRIELYIKKGLKEYFSDRKVVWQDVDTVEAISNKIIDKNFKEGDIVVLNNVFRRYTISAHLFRFTKGRLKTIPVAQVKNVLKLVKDRCMVHDLTITYDPNFSNILVYSNKVSKHTAVRDILNMYKDKKIYSIGDDINDYRMIEGLGTFLAVRNAAKAVRQKSLFCSGSPNARGVRELLEKI